MVKMSSSTPVKVTELSDMTELCSGHDRGMVALTCATLKEEADMVRHTMSSFSEASML